MFSKDIDGCSFTMIVIAFVANHLRQPVSHSSQFIVFKMRDQRVVLTVILPPRILRVYPSGVIPLQDTCFEIV